MEEEREDKMEVATPRNFQNIRMEFLMEGIPILALNQPYPEKVDVVLVEDVVVELTPVLNKSMLSVWILTLHQPHPEEVKVVVVEGVVLELTPVLNKSMLREWILTLMITIIGLLLHH